jgi:hypothetical protein
MRSYMKIITPKVHTYGLIYKTSEIFALILSPCVIASGLFILYLFFDSLAAGYKYDINSILIVLTCFLVYEIWLPILFMLIACMYPDMEVQNDGIEVRSILKKYFIKWDEIIEIKPLRPFSIFTHKNAKVIIIKNNLTFIHRLYGLLYAGKSTPAILIYRKISEYDLLMDNISTQVKKISVESVSN